MALKKIKKILLICPTLGEFGEKNGVEKTYRNHIDQFIQRNIPVDVITFGPKSYVKKKGSVNIKVHKIKSHLKLHDFDEYSIEGNVFELIKLYNEFSKKQYSLVHSAAPDTLGIVGLAIAKKQNIPFITEANTDLDTYAELRFREKMGVEIGKIMKGVSGKYFELIFNASTLIFTPSKEFKKEIIHRFKPPLRVLPRGIDLKKFNPSFRDRKNGKVRVIHVGRLAPEKNLDQLIRVFKKICAMTSDIELVVVGEGSYYEKIKKALPKAKCVGRKKGKPLFKAYANSDIFFSTSKTETFCNVILEAMASGLPVVAVDGAVIRNLVKHKKTGYVETSDKMIVKRIIRLARNKKLRKKLGRAGCRNATLYDLPSVFDRMIKYYLLAKRIYRKKGLRRALARLKL